MGASKRGQDKKQNLTDDYSIGWSRPHLVEALEPRLLLSADSALSGITGGFDAGLDALGSSIQEYIEVEGLFDTFVPGVLDPDISEEALLSRTIEYLLQIRVDQDQSGGVNGNLENALNAISDDGIRVTFEDYFAATFTQRIHDFMNTWNPLLLDFDGNTDDDMQFVDEFEDFLNGAFIESDLTHIGDLFDLSVSAIGNFGVNEVTWDIDFLLTFNHDLVLDLGGQSDDLGIFFPADGTDAQTTVVGGSFDFSMTLGFDRSSETFFLTPDGDLTFWVDTNVDSLVDADIHVGFLGTSASGGFHIHMPIGTQLLDPSTPNFLGFTADPTISGNMIIADAAPRVFDIDAAINIVFTLMIGENDMAPIEVTLTQALTNENMNIGDLAVSLQNAIGIARLGSCSSSRSLMSTVKIDLPSGSSRQTQPHSASVTKFLSPM